MSPLGSVRESPNIQHDFRILPAMVLHGPWWVELGVEGADVGVGEVGVEWWGLVCWGVEGGDRRKGVYRVGSAVP